MYLRIYNNNTRRQSRATQKHLLSRGIQRRFFASLPLCSVYISPILHFSIAIANISLCLAREYYMPHNYFNAFPRATATKLLARRWLRVSFWCRSQRRPGRGNHNLFVLIVCVSGWMGWAMGGWVAGMPTYVKHAWATGETIGPHSEQSVSRCVHRSAHSRLSRFSGVALPKCVVVVVASNLILIEATLNLYLKDTFP